MVSPSTAPTVAQKSTQATKSNAGTSEAVNRTIREAYKWLVAPTEEADGKTVVKGGLKGDQCGGAIGSHLGLRRMLGLRGRGPLERSGRGFRPREARLVGGARSWAYVCFGSV